MHKLYKHLQRLELSEYDMDEKTDPYFQTPNYRGMIHYPNGSFGIQSGDTIAGVCFSGPPMNYRSHLDIIGDETVICNWETLADPKLNSALRELDQDDV